ncbi:MAG: beta-ketoacyl synthase [Reichenbachiella sp.]
MIYIGNEHIISPIGLTAAENFEAAQQGESALKMHKEFKGNEVSFPFGWMADYTPNSGLTKLESLVLDAVLACLNGKQLENCLLILSTTKGDIDHLQSLDIEKAKPSYLAKRVVSQLSFEMDWTIVSNACISGISAIVLGHDMIQSKQYDHVVVVGADLFSEFTLKGFDSFFALSDTACQPFDSNRKGLSLGEVCASVLISNNRNCYEQVPMELLGGASSNDANHISGPSRNGEGLYRAIQKCLEFTGVKAEDIDVVSGHGTATRYNDDMESIAFNRCGLGDKPLNSLKGYFGHTLGAAGVLEVSMFMQSARQNVMLKTLGCSEPGTTEQLNIQLENKEMPIQTVLKTASGFGGCNGALIFRKIDE